jgi:hypothetical protein
MQQICLLHFLQRVYDKFTVANKIIAPEQEDKRGTR